MKKYKQKYLWGNIFYSNFTIVVLIIFIIFVLNGLYKLYVKYYFTNVDLISVNDEKRQENEKLVNIQNKISDINTDKGKDKYIRETYSVSKNGEGVIVIYNSPESTYSIEKDDSYWKKFLDYISHFWR